MTGTAGSTESQTSSLPDHVIGRKPITKREETASRAPQRHCHDHDIDANGADAYQLICHVLDMPVARTAALLCVLALSIPGGSVGANADVKSPSAGATDSPGASDMAASARAQAVKRGERGEIADKRTEDSTTWTGCCRWRSSGPEVGAAGPLNATGLRVEWLAQVQVAAQSYTGLADVVRRTLCCRCRPPVGEQLLEDHGRGVVRGRDVDDHESRLREVFIPDRFHTLVDAVVATVVQRAREIHPRERRWPGAP